MGAKKTALLSSLLFSTLTGSALIYICFYPLPRQFFLTLRNDLYILPLIVFLAFLSCVTRPWALRSILWATLAALIFAPLGGLWNSGVSEQYFLGGVIPWSDAFTLQLNTQRFLYGGQMGQSTALRPLSSVFYAFILYLSHNNYLVVHIALAFLIMVGILICTRQLSAISGPISAAVFYAINFFYIRQRIGTFMSEPYGFVVGIFSCALFLAGIRKKNNPLLILSAMTLSFALCIRPGPMFLLPAFFFWFIFIWLKETKKRLFFSIVLLCAMLIPFGINNLSRKLVYGTANIPNRQMGEIVYGLCQGGKSAYEVLNAPEIIALNDSDNVLRDVAGLCLPIIKERPENLWLAFKAIFWDCLITDAERGAFSFFNGGAKWMVTVVRFGFMLVWCLGIVYCVKKRKSPLMAFLLSCAIALLITQLVVAPFTTYRLRYHAVSIWIPALICAVYLQNVADKISPTLFAKPTSPSPRVELIPAALSLCLLCLALIAPIIIQRRPLPIPAIANACAEGEETLLTSIDPGSFIYLQNPEKMKYSHVPYFRLPFIRQQIHNTASVEMFDFTDAIEQPTAIIRSIDLENKKDALIFSPLELVEGIVGPVRFCGNFINPPILRNDRFFIPHRIMSKTHEAEK